MLLSDWMLDSLAELILLDAEPELMAHFTTLSPSCDILLSLNEKESFLPGEVEVFTY